MDETKKFHGMTVVSDYDLVAVKRHHVLEVNSNQDIVCRYYDSEGNAEDNPMIINVLDFCASNHNKKLTESNITGFIKREVGTTSLLISESAIKEIKSFLH